MHQASILANLLFPILHLFLLFPQVPQPWAPTGGQAKDPKHAHLPPAGLDFKDSKKEKEKGLSFQCLPGTQPTALLCALLARSPAVPASPPQNIRSEDGPCLGSSCRLACPTQTSSRAHGCSSISPFRGITRQKGGQPPRRPISSLTGSPLPSSRVRAPRAPQKPTRRALTSRRSERRAAEMGGLGRGKRIPSALVSWRRREQSQRLPSPQSPARGRSQPRGERRSPAAPRWL